MANQNPNTGQNHNSNGVPVLYPNLSRTLQQPQQKQQQIGLPQQVSQRLVQYQQSRKPGAPPPYQNAVQMSYGRSDFANQQPGLLVVNASGMLFQQPKLQQFPQQQQTFIVQNQPAQETGPGWRNEYSCKHCKAKLPDRNHGKPPTHGQLLFHLNKNPVCKEKRELEMGMYTNLLEANPNSNIDIDDTVSTLQVTVERIYDTEVTSNIQGKSGHLVKNDWIEKTWNRENTHSLQNRSR